jgi:hypothetical protein
VRVVCLVLLSGKLVVGVGHAVATVALRPVLYHVRLHR